MAGTEGKITCVNNEESGNIGKIKGKAGLKEGKGDINSKGDAHCDGEKGKLTELMADKKKDKNDAEEELRPSRQWHCYDEHVWPQHTACEQLFSKMKQAKNAPSGEGDKMFKKPVKRPGDTPLDLTVSTSKKSKDGDPDIDDSELQNSNLMPYNDDDDDEEDEEDEEEEDEEDDEDEEDEEEEDDDEEAEEET